MSNQAIGYVDILRKEFMDILGASKISQFCYPGNRLSDGGLVRVNELIKSGADICIIEPNIESEWRGVLCNRDEALYVYSQILGAGIYTVCLLLAHQFTIRPELAEQYAIHREICDTLNIPTIEVNLENVHDLERHFRGIHPNRAGARVYANRLIQQWKKLNLSRSALRRFFKTLQLPSSGIQVNSVKYQVDDAMKGLRLHGRFLNKSREDEIPNSLKVIQHQTIGPFSPVLNVNFLFRKGDGWQQKKWQLSIWDRYCFSERSAYIVLFDYPQIDCDEFIIDYKISDIEPAYSTCVSKVHSWPRKNEWTLKSLGDLYVVSNMQISVKAVPDDVSLPNTAEAQMDCAHKLQDECLPLLSS
ncbi:MAG: hypothetical protein JXX14_17650 [Deltaproteobacteria bacterium]|nr:hypothetical protein [Deltaproteobacteria bacterium]